MENKKMTTPIISVGADTEQSLNVCNDSITDSAENFKDLEKSLRENAERNVKANGSVLS